LFLYRRGGKPSSTIFLFCGEKREKEKSPFKKGDKPPHWRKRKGGEGEKFLTPFQRREERGGGCFLIPRREERSNVKGIMLLSKG